MCGICDNRFKEHKEKEYTIYHRHNESLLWSKNTNKLLKENVKYHKDIKTSK